MQSQADAAFSQTDDALHACGCDVCPGRGVCKRWADTTWIEGDLAADASVSEFAQMTASAETRNE